MLSISITAQNAGDLDLNYGISGKTTMNFGQATFYISNQAIQTDGKIVLVGSMYNESNSFGFILRLNSDGTVDTSFNTTGRVYNTFISNFKKVILLTDGKILVIGEEKGEVALARYSTSGALDTTFDGDGMNYETVFTGGLYLYDVALQSDGKIITLSKFFSATNPNFRIRRYNSNGSIDPSFGTNGQLFYDLSYNETPAAIAVLADDKFYIAGSSSSGSTRNVFVTKHNSDGFLDTTFNTTGIKLTSFTGSTSSTTSDMVVQPDGKIVTSNQVYVAGVPRIIMVRYNTNGNLDTTFDSDGAAVTITTSGFGALTDGELKIQSDGKIVLMQTMQPIINGNSNQEILFLRYNSNGSLDTTFDGDGQLYYSYFSLNDNATDFDFIGTKILVCGNTEENYAQNKIAIARLNTNGAFDNSFDSDGKLFYSFPFAGADNANCSKLQPDGKLIVGGNSYLNNSNYTLSRYNVDGSIDTSFGVNGVTVINRYTFGELNTIDLDSTGKILVSGGNNFDVFRLNSNGTLDGTFGTDGFADSPGGFASAQAIKVLSNGKILVAGNIGSTINSVYSGNYLLARLNSNGTFDTTFGTNGYTTLTSGDGQEDLYDVEVQNDGKIVTIGNISNGADRDVVVFRCNSNGTLDNTFNGNGIATFGSTGSDYTTNLEIQNDGKILIGSNFETPLSPAIVRLTSSGSFDTTFDGDGILNIDANDMFFMNDFKLAADQSIVVGGFSSFSSNTSNFSILKLNSNGTIDTNFGNQGKVSTDFYGYSDFINEVNITSDNKAIFVGSTYNVTNFSSDIAIAKYHLANVLSNNESLQQKTTTFYPNPANDYIYLSTNVKSFAIYTLEGKYIQTTTQNQSIDVSELSSGIYIAQSIMDDDRVINEKIVID